MRAAPIPELITSGYDVKLLAHVAIFLYRAAWPKLAEKSRITGVKGACQGSVCYVKRVTLLKRGMGLQMSPGARQRGSGCTLD